LDDADADLADRGVLGVLSFVPGVLDLPPDINFWISAAAGSVTLRFTFGTAGAPVGAGVVVSIFADIFLC